MLFLFFILPLAYFYYEEQDEEVSSTGVGVVNWS